MTNFSSSPAALYDRWRWEKLFRRDAETSTRDACATLQLPSVLTISILFAFVFFWWRDAIIHGVGMQHHRAEIKEKKTKTPTRRRECSQQHEDPHRDRASHPEKARHDMSLVNMSQARDDTEQNRHCVARFAFGGLSRHRPRPSVPVTLFRFLWQEMSAVWTSHFISHARFGPSRRCVRVIHAHVKYCRASVSDANC